MRILVAGATGAVGQRLVARLVRAGHTVFGLSRKPGSAALVRQFGAEPVVADALDEASIRSAVRSARAEVIVHELTDLKGVSDLRRFDRVFANSNRLRTLGTDNLLAAARDAGTGRMVVQSFCGWPYARGGGNVKSESDPLDPNPPREMRRTLEAIRHLESAVTTSPSIDGVVLRYGSFYGPDTGVFAAAAIDQVRKRRFPLIGAGTGWWSFIHIDDAADATAAAIERGAGIYNIVGDDPAPVGEWLPALADMLAARPPIRLPAWLARMLVGEHLVVMMTEARAGSNEKAKAELGWRPQHPSWREGFAETIRGERRLAA